MGLFQQVRSHPIRISSLIKTKLHKSAFRHGAVLGQHAPVSIKRFPSDHDVRIRTNCVRIFSAHGAVFSEHGAVSSRLSFSINAAKNPAHLDQLGGRDLKESSLKQS